MQTTLFVALVLAVSSEARSGAPASDLPGWVAVPMPSEDALWCANRWGQAWALRVEGGGVLATPHDELDRRRDAIPFEFSYEQEVDGRQARRVALQLDSEWLIGIDLGTYGGGLWEATRGTQPPRRLWSENVRELAQIGGRVFALGGAPMLERGVVAEVARDAGGLRIVREVATLLGYPEVAMTEGDQLLAITQRGLARISSDGQARMEIELSLRALYPTSLVRDRRGSLYVGMRHYLVQLRETPNGWQQQWLAPERCAGYRVEPVKGREERCVCVPN